MTSAAQLNRNLMIIYAAGFFRSIGVGLTGVLFGLYLSRSSFSAAFIGLAITAGLAGAALGMLVVSFRADQVGRRRTLAVFSLLGAAGGLGFALTSRPVAIIVFALLGMLNAFGTDRGPAFALEQAVIPQLTSTERRTWALAWYSVGLDAAHALGALGATLPSLFRHALNVNLLVGYKLTFVVLAGVNLVSAVLYLFLTPEVEAARRDAPAARGSGRISPQSKNIVYKLAALSGMDSLGGGFLTDALIAYWFFRRFGVTEGSLGFLFFAGHLLNSASYPVAAWLARRVGLVNTMVFTHIPSSLFLMAVPFAPTPALAIVFFLAREFLVEMDVPTRQSYVMGVVQPDERTFSSGVTNLTRSVARAISPSFAGYLMQTLALASPLLIGGGIKIVYDVALYRAFRSLKPPEEQTRSESSRAAPP